MKLLGVVNPHIRFGSEKFQSRKLIFRINTLNIYLFAYFKKHKLYFKFKKKNYFSADYWLELIKMAQYAKLEKLCTNIYVIFVFVWISTRLIIFPFK